MPNKTYCLALLICPTFTSDVLRALADRSSCITEKLGRATIVAGDNGSDLRTGQTDIDVGCVVDAARLGKGYIRISGWSCLPMGREERKYKNVLTGISAADRCSR